MVTRDYHKFDPLLLYWHLSNFPLEWFTLNAGEMSSSVRGYAKFMTTRWLKHYITN